MSIEIKVKPYISVGKCVFGTTRNELIKMLGEPISTNNNGYPSSDGFIDDYKTTPHNHLLQTKSTQPKAECVEKRSIFIARVH